MTNLVIFRHIGNSPNNELALKRFEATSVTEWEECVIVAGKALSQLVQGNWFVPVSSAGWSFSSHCLSQPSDVQTWYFTTTHLCQTCAWLVLRGGDRDGSICTGEMTDCRVLNLSGLLVVMPQHPL